MALVDYESSDEDDISGTDDKKDEKVASNQNTIKDQVVKTNNVSFQNQVVNDQDSIFSGLPKPKGNFTFLMDEKKLSNLLLSKKTSTGSNQKTEKEVIKISVPSISDFNDEDEPQNKKPKFSPKKGGLFSILPPPKNVNTLFTPSKVSFANNTPRKIENSAPKNDKDDDSLEDSDDEFSTLSTATIPNFVIEDESTTSKKYEPSSEIPEYFELSQSSQEDESCMSQPEPEVSGNEEPVEDNPLELDEKALQILCGGKKKRQQMPMNIIDLSGEEIMPDSKEWLLKQFTEEKKVRSHSHKKGQGPSTQQRRKHQITYLAFQAKAQELELQNQWANNRMSRRQTQSKYGF